MTQKTTAAILLILSALATTGANSASAQGEGFKGGGFRGGDRDGRGFHGRVVGRFVGADGYGDNHGYGDDNGYGDWYGISSGHDECPLFRKRVMTSDGWRVRMVPVC